MLLCFLCVCVVVSRCCLLERMNSLSRTWCPRCLSLSVRSTRVCTLHSAAACLLWSDILTVDPLVVAQFFSLRNSFVHDDLQLSSSVGVLAPYSFSCVLCLLTLGLLRRQVVDFKVLPLLPLLLFLRLGRRGGQVLVSVELWTLRVEKEKEREEKKTKRRRR